MKAQRMYDLDWLRVIAIILVLYFHVAMIFTAEWDWHIKNKELSNLWLEFNYWLSRFRMPLLFFISGVGSFFALRKRTGWLFIKERHNRLVIPLVFAMFFIVPPQIYMERMFDGATYSSFWDFYPQTFNLVPYPEGDFSWHHMWFVCYLFVYSIVALPLFVWIKSERGKQFMAKQVWLGKKSFIYLLILPTVLVYLFWTVKFERTNNLIEDWGWICYWFTFFLIGYIVASRQEFWDSLERNRRNSLKWAFLCIIALNYLRWNKILPWDTWGDDWYGHWEVFGYLALEAIDAWLWLFALIGYGRKYLNKPSKLLAYANEGIYPFYILHQTIIIVIGYYIIHIEESIGMKYLAVSTLSFVITVGIYEFFIRPYGLMRFLFGVKAPFKLKRKEKIEPETKPELIKEESFELSGN